MPRWTTSWVIWPHPGRSATTAWSTRSHSSEGVTWHDGEAFDADDVVYSINKLTDPDRSALASTFAAVCGRREGGQPHGQGDARRTLSQFPPATRGTVRRHASGASGGNGRYVHRLPGRNRPLDLRQLPGGREPRIRTQPELLQGRAAVHRHLHPVHPRGRCRTVPERAPGYLPGEHGRRDRARSRTPFPTPSSTRRRHPRPSSNGST